MNEPMKDQIPQDQCGQTMPESQTLSTIFYNDGINGLLAYFRRRIDEATKPLHARIERLINDVSRLRFESSQWQEAARELYHRAITEDCFHKTLVEQANLCTKPPVFYIEPPKAATYQMLLNAQTQFFDTGEKAVYMGGNRGGATGEKVVYGGGHHGGATRSTINYITLIAHDIINKEHEAHAATMSKLESSRKTIAQALETAETLSRELSKARLQVSERDAILHTRKLQIKALRNLLDSFAGPGVSSLCLDKPELMIENKTEVRK